MNKVAELPGQKYTETESSHPSLDLLRGYELMVLGRRLDKQATNLAKQGLLTVYPSSLGQEACQVGAALALRKTDWLFPTYRDTVAIISRGIEPIQALTMLRGDWHCGFDPKKECTAPHATPLATQVCHAVGLALAAKYSGDDTVALALCGEGSTSEGDFHEAINLAAVFNAPVVFLVQNNGYAISVPVDRQFKAKSISDKGIGYGVEGIKVDGNNFGEVSRTLNDAVSKARQGKGPTLIEAITYRMAPHTNADDPSLYRDESERNYWLNRDPINALRLELLESGGLTKKIIEEIDAIAESSADKLRIDIADLPLSDAKILFSYVYSKPPGHLEQQRDNLIIKQAHT
jgi:pyruvate dehydrogenase E1 component alpha subunit